MLVYLLSGVIAFPLIAAALWSRGVVPALLGASVGASVIAGAAALALNLHRSRRRRAVTGSVGEARINLAD